MRSLRLLLGDTAIKTTAEEEPDRYLEDQLKDPVFRMSGTRPLATQPAAATRGYGDINSY
jgi:hypothetical protein